MTMLANAHKTEANWILKAIENFGPSFKISVRGTQASQPASQEPTMNVQNLQAERNHIRHAIREQADYINYLIAAGEPSQVIDREEVRLESLHDDYVTLDYQLHKMEY